MAKEPRFKVTIGKLRWKNVPDSWGHTCSVTLKCEPESKEYTYVTIAGIAVSKLETMARAISHWRYFNDIDSWTSPHDDSDIYTYEITLRDLALTGTQVLASLNAVAEFRSAGIPDTDVTVRSETIEADVDPNIFVYHATPTGDPFPDGDTFSNIASYYDMITLPVGDPVTVPDPDTSQEAIPFYRVDEMTLSFITAADAARFIRIAKYDIAKLSSEYDDSVKVQDNEVIHV